MKKLMAGSILTTMALGLAAWAGTAIVDNKVEISALKAEKRAMHEDIREIKKDVKLLLRRK